ncbi:BufA1 family periplasmic bufferin-type metallophore [Burkholderia sp. PU8-34]
MNSERIIQGAIAGLLALGVAAASTSALAAGDFEKCAGIAKAGKNDCGTSKSSCAASVKIDHDAEAWVLLPKGTCDKIAGGHLQLSEFAKPGGKSGILSPAAKAAMAAG